MMLMFIFHFTTSCFCLALGRDKQERLLSSTWEIMSNETRRSLEQQLDCCGLINSAEKQQDFLKDVNHCTALVTVWLAVQYRNQRNPELISRSSL
ncbi:tetraspanin-31 isoform X1 [Silurus meridionalis]|nr:tetraspanin-31 isoform X1 [Silurus meridionalis]